MTTISGVDRDLSEMMHAVFAKHAKSVDDADGILGGALWQQLAELGLTRLTGSEESGGSGASWLEAAELLSAAAQSGVRTPLAEHDLLAGALLEAASLPVDDRVRTVALLDSSGTADRVAWASTAECIVMLWRAGDTWHIADLTVAAGVEIVPGCNLVGEPRDFVQVEAGELRGTSIDEVLVEQYRLKGAMARAVATSAALDRVMTLSVEHATTRTQFGRPLARFQAVQNLIADMATECALARAATEAALVAAVRGEWSSEGLGFRIAVARSCVGHATTAVVRNAHQIHGAIGTAREHDLPRFTRAALAWRGEFGSVDHWDRVLAGAAAAAGPEGLWKLIAG